MNPLAAIGQAFLHFFPGARRFVILALCGIALAHKLMRTTDLAPQLLGVGTGASAGAHLGG